MQNHPRLDLLQRKEVSLAPDFGAGSGEGTLADGFVAGACIRARGSQRMSRVGLVWHFRTLLSRELARVPRKLPQSLL